MANKKPTGESIKPIKNKMGRPTDYSQDIATKICEEIITGKSLRTVCQDPKMPTPSTIFLWLVNYPDFSKQYEAATQERSEAYMEEIVDIADDSKNDYIEDDYMKGKTPGYQLNQENIQRARLRVDVRKWYASKMKPKRYGDKLDVTSEGEKLEGLIVVEMPKDD